MEIRSNLATMQEFYGCGPVALDCMEQGSDMQFSPYGPLSLKYRSKIVFMPLLGMFFMSRLKCMYSDLFPRQEEYESVLKDQSLAFTSEWRPSFRLFVL